MRVLDLGREASRFVGVGALNTLLTFLLYQALLFAVPYQVAYTLSFAAGIVFSAVVNARVTFGTTLTARTGLRFAAFYLFNYGLGLALLTVLVEFGGISPVIAPVLAIVLLLPVSFFGSRIALLGKARHPDAV